MRLQQILEARYMAPPANYALTNTGRVFNADARISPDFDDAKKILGRQLPKVTQLAKKLGIKWTDFYVKQFLQQPDYLNRYKWVGNKREKRPPRKVWTYVLVGHDKNNNEIAYLKYEGGTGGSGRSTVYANKKNETKLSTLLASTPAQCKAKLGITNQPNQPDATEPSSLPKNIKELYPYLKKAFGRNKMAKFVEDDRGKLRLAFNKKGAIKSGLSFKFFWHKGNISVNCEHLNGRDRTRGYSTQPRSWTFKQSVGKYSNIPSLISGIKEYVRAHYNR